jgi:putative peptide maturation system protein
MKGTLQQTLIDTLDYIMTLSREDTRPEEAKTRLRFLQRRYPDTEMKLLWEEEPYDQSVHYDVLLRPYESGTVSLSFCPDRALPWPIRGVHRWSESDLVRVDNTVLKIEQAIACLDFIWDETQIITRLVNVCLIHAELDKDPIDLSDAELQLAMDSFRRAHKLYKPEDTYRWMEQHGMTHEQLESYVADEARVAKLRDCITAGRVEDYFEEHRADFDTAFIARIEFCDEASAHQAHEQIARGEMDFYQAAQRRFLTAELSSETFAPILRGQALPNLGAAVFSAEPGEVVGPVRTAESYTIARILSFAHARLDERTRREIKKILFEDWLEERRRAATIEWYWGNANRTSQVT